MKPIIKYRGGKAKEIPFFEKFFPKTFNIYFEPFFGGGAVFFYLHPARAVVNDINPKVMAFYQEIRDNYAEVRRQLDQLEKLYNANQQEYLEKKRQTPERRVENKNEALYYQLRDMFNGKIASKFLASVIYFFINKTAYSGMIRYNAEGEYNVPFGRYQNFNTHLLTDEHSRLLQGAEVTCMDFAEVFKRATEDDFMFLDPPYDCIFNDYGNLDRKDGFDETEHIRLSHAYKHLRCKALMVIGKTPLTEKLYEGFIRDEYFKSYAVNIRNRFKSEAKHIIVTNY